MSREQTYTKIHNELDALKLSEKTRARILDPNWVYVDSRHTDITKTWRKYGWKPVGEKDGTL